MRQFMAFAGLQSFKGMELDPGSPPGMTMRALGYQLSAGNWGHGEWIPASPEEPLEDKMRAGMAGRRSARKKF